MRIEFRGFFIATLAGVAIALNAAIVAAQPGASQPSLRTPRADDPIPENRFLPLPGEVPSSRPVPRINPGSNPGLIVPRRTPDPSGLGYPPAQSQFQPPIEPLQVPGSTPTRFYASNSPCESQRDSCSARKPRRRGLFTPWIEKRKRCDCPVCQAARCEVTAQPVGFSVHQFQQAQIGRGRQAQMVFQLYDFEPDSARLNIGGERRALRIAQLLPTNIYPVVIATSQDSTLDERRRKAVTAALQSVDFPLPEQRIVVQRPTFRGLDGVDLQILEQRRRMHSLQSDERELPNLDPRIFDRIQ
ncbi:MAG: hypothetical protein O3A00_23105 [Planctomycetota bacterium]|nr:hypothetical protein [Planctomycetota bacterium]